LSTVVGFLFVAIQKFKDGKKGNKKAKKVDIEASKHTDASATKVLAEETQGKTIDFLPVKVNFNAQKVLPQLCHRDH
jgi:nitrogen fixation protein FixH